LSGTVLFTSHVRRVHKLEEKPRIGLVKLLHQNAPGKRGVERSLPAHR